MHQLQIMPSKCTRVTYGVLEITFINCTMSDLNPMYQFCTGGSVPMANYSSDATCSYYNSCTLYVIITLVRRSVFCSFN